MVGSFRRNLWPEVTETSRLLNGIAAKADDPKHDAFVISKTGVFLAAFRYLAARALGSS